MGGEGLVGERKLGEGKQERERDPIQRTPAKKFDRQTDTSTKKLRFSKSYRVYTQSEIFDGNA